MTEADSGRAQLCTLKYRLEWSSSGDCALLTVYLYSRQVTLGTCVKLTGTVLKYFSYTVCAREGS